MMSKKKISGKAKSVSKSKEIKRLEEQLARALADYDNLSKRVQKEKGKLEKLSNMRLITRLLPVYDMLINVQNHVNDSGLTITIEEFKHALEEEGVEGIQAKIGSVFNENLHEAVEIINKGSKNKEGEIAGTVLTGWRFKDGPVIRATKVKVYGKNNRN